MIWMEVYHYDLDEVFLAETFEEAILDVYLGSGRCPFFACVC